MLAALADDPDVSDDALVLRRVGWQVLGGIARHPPGTTPPLSGNAFRDYSTENARSYGFAGPCMSVGLSTVVEAEGLGFEDAMLRGFPDYGLASVRVGDLRNLRRANGDPSPQGVMLAPTDDEPWHAVIFDLADLGQCRPDGASKAIAKVATWLVPLVRAVE